MAIYRRQRSQLFPFHSLWHGHHRIVFNATQPHSPIHEANILYGCVTASSIVYSARQTWNARSTHVHTHTQTRIQQTYIDTGTAMHRIFTVLLLIPRGPRAMPAKRVRTSNINVIRLSIEGWWWRWWCAWSDSEKQKHHGLMRTFTTTIYIRVGWTLCGGQPILFVV